MCALSTRYVCSSPHHRRPHASKLRYVLLLAPHHMACGPAACSEIGTQVVAFRLPLPASPLPFWPFRVRVVCHSLLPSSVSCLPLVGCASGGRVEGKAAGLPGPGSGGREAKLPHPSDRAVQGVYYARHLFHPSCHHEPISLSLSVCFVCLSIRPECLGCC